MAAILQLRRGSTTPSLAVSELFFNTGSDTLHVGGTASTVTLVKIGSNTGNVTLLGDLSVSGTTILTTITGSNLYITENVSIDGNIHIGGNITLGSGSDGDIVNVNAPLSGSIIPDITNVYDLGTPDKKYRNLYVLSASIDNVSLPGSGILSSSNENFTTFSQSVDSRLDDVEESNTNSDFRLNSLESFTGSQETKNSTLGTYTSSVDSDLTELFSSASDHEIRLDEIETTFSSSVDLRLDYLEVEFSSSVDDRLDQLQIHSASTDNRLDNLELTSASHDNRLDSLELTSASHDDRLDQLEIETGSISLEQSVQDGRLNNLELTSESYDSRLDQLETETGSIALEQSIQDGRLDNLELTSESHDGRLDYLEGEFSTSLDTRLDLLENFSSSEYNNDSQSFDSRLDYLEGEFSTSVDSRLDNIEDYTSSLKQAIDLDGQNLIVYGDLTVQGTTTTLNTTELVIEDKLLSLASGSTTSAEADGAGIHISGADASMLWDDVNSNLVFNQKVSSSVGFKGDGSELTGVTAADIDFYDISNKPTLVSGSSQVTSSLDFRYLQIDGDNVVSGSSQITITDTTGFTSFSGSLKSTDDVQDSRLNSLELFSSSQETKNSTLSTLTSSYDSRLSNLESRSGSQEDKNSTLATYTGSVDTYITNLVAFTSSQEDKNSTLQSYTESVDLQLTELYSSASNHEDRIDILESFSSSIDNTIKIKLDVEGVVSSSLDTTTLSLSIQDGVISGEVIGGIVSGSDQVTSSLDLRYEVSGSVSDLVGIRATSGSLGSAAWYNVSASISNGDPAVLGTAGAVKDYIDEQLLIIGAGDITSVIAGDGMSGGADSGPATLTLDTASAHFTEGVVGNLTSLNLFTASLDADYVTQVELAAVTGVLETYNTNQDDRLTNLELFTASLDTDYVTQIELAVATGSLIDLIATKLDTGSYNIDSSSFDNRLDQLEADSSSQGGRLDNLELTSASHDSRLDSLELTSSSYDDRLDNIESFTSSIDSTIKTKLDFEGVISGSVQILGGSGILSSSNENFTDFSQSVDSRLDDAEAANASGNDRLNSLEGFTSSIDTTIKTKLNVEGVISGSSQLTSSYDSRYVTLDGDQTINGTKTFNDIVVNGTGSFAYITSVTGDAKIIGDAFIYLNNDTPTQRYAGLVVLDSGSANTTASFYFDGETNNWGYEYSSSTGVDYAVTIFGPEYTTKGTPTYLTTNKIPKAVDNHHLNDSNISDDGTTITLGSNVQLNGNLNLTGGISGLNLVSGSIQITKTLQEVTTAGNTTNTSISITNSTASTSKTTGALIVTGGIGTSGDVFAGGDVVAYASSDRRLKDNILPIENPLQKINQIGGYSFDWNVEKQNIYKGKDYGVIAQEIEEILPELVDTRENGYKAVKYDKLVSLLIEGIKDLSQQVEELKQKINKG